METEQQSKTNGRKTINGALIMLLRAGVIATFGLVLGAGIAAGVPSR